MNDIRKRNGLQKIRELLQLAKEFDVIHLKFDGMEFTRSIQQFTNLEKLKAIELPDDERELQFAHTGIVPEDLRKRQ